MAVRCVDGDLDGRSAGGPRSRGTSPSSVGPALAAGGPDASRPQAMVADREGCLPATPGVAGVERGRSPSPAWCRDEFADGNGAQSPGTPKAPIAANR